MITPPPANEGRADRVDVAPNKGPTEASQRQPVAKGLKERPLHVEHVLVENVFCSLPRGLGGGGKPRLLVE